MAPRTLQARTYLAQRLADFLSANGLPRNEQSMLLFLEATRTKPTSRLTYLNHLKHVLNPRPLAESYARALRRSAAITPLRQAPPLSQPEINKLYSCLPPNERPLLYLALRSGMRLDELTNLAPIHVLEAHPTRISLYWGAHTKSSRLSPFEPQLFVVVGIPHPHNQYHPPNYMKEAATLLSRPRSNRPYSQLTARQWLKMLRLANPNATGHSLKRTTALRAFTVMASNPQLPPWLLPLVLKHKTPTPIAAGDIRYACETPQARVAVAAALRTELLTQHL